GNDHRPSHNQHCCWHNRNQGYRFAAAWPRHETGGTTMKKTVLVLFGGQSPEHPVSIVTAAGVLNAMTTGQYTPIPVGINQQGDWVLAGSHQPRDAQAPV